MHTDLPPAIDLAGVTKSYGDLAALAIDRLTVPSGQMLGLIGPNGAGKSTLIRVLCGLTCPTAADRLEVLGHDPRRARRELKARIGLVLDSTQLYGQLTADENLQFHGRLHGARLTSEQRAEVLAVVGLEDRARELVATYSTGMRQRLNIARAVSVGADLLLLDEPTSGLDPQSSQVVYGLLAGLSARGLTVVVSSHDMNEVDALCERVLFMDGGRVVADGHPDELKAQLAARVSYLDVPDGDLDDVLRALVRHGVRRWVKRKTSAGWGVLVIDEVDPAHIDALGHPFSRRPVDLDDVFLHVVNRAQA